MGHTAQRPKKRKIRVVGGGFRFTRESNGVKGGTMKSLRRAQRRIDKSKKKRG